MSDPRSQRADQPTEQELQAYLEQLRAADAAEIVAQAYTMLGTGAEVKLGRSDARVLIDAMGALAESAAGALDGDLVERMRNGVVQLQTAQVQAERRSGAGAPAGGGAATPPPAAAGAPAQGPQPQGPQPQGKEPGGQSMTERLWIPGREPR
ncbi:MAG TPA: hypothetical protein VM324_08335 [Egibacteraceae bacterium]|nr:hypothetical protein [Egibacteraceae bacterium]